MGGRMRDERLAALGEYVESRPVMVEADCRDTTAIEAELYRALLAERAAFDAEHEARIAAEESRDSWRDTAERAEADCPHPSGECSDCGPGCGR